jgi:hypothetical protein
MKRTAGSLPTIRVAAADGAAGGVTATKPIAVRMCVDASGAVSSVQVGAAPKPIVGVVNKALREWRFVPHEKGGKPVAACFSTAIRLDVVVGAS